MSGVMTIDAWRAARAARDAGVASVDMVVEQFAAGFCYLRLIVPELRLAATKVVGAWPSLLTLMKLPAGMFHSGEELSRERCAFVGDNELHVGRGGISLGSVVAHAAMGLDGPFDTFGSIWVPRYSGLLLTVDEIRSLLVGGAGVAPNVCSSVEVLVRPAVERVEQRLAAMPGYCYVGLVHADCALMAMQYLGPDPTLGDLLKAPFRIFDVSKFGLGVDVVERGGLHVSLGGANSFYALAYTAIVGSEGFFSVGTLGSHLLDNPGEKLDVEVRLGWTIGALSASAAALAAELARLSGLPLANMHGPDLEIACKTAALLGSADKARLRILEAVGDNALSMLVVQRCAAENMNVQEYQDARGTLTNNGYLGDLFVKTGFDVHVQFVAGVAHDGKVGGSCFEVMIGIVYNAGSMGAVGNVCAKIGYYGGFPKWSNG